MMSSQGFDEMTKKALLSRLAKIEPHVQRLAKSKHSGSEAEEKELFVSKHSKEEKERELEDIVKVRLPAIKEAIQIAKEHGDLKENSEYKMARQDHDTLAARRAELDGILKKAKVTDFKEANTDTISVGSSVVLRRGSDQAEIAYDLLGAWDGEPEKNILSYISPLAKQFLNHKTGETFTTNINGKAESWTVVRITRWVDKR
jgi:transcription elongation GreA/GreB family factor